MALQTNDPDFVLADALVMEWHHWSAAWRPSLAAPGVAAGMRLATSSRQYETQPLAEDVRQREMEAVEWCIDSLSAAEQAAIGVEMRHRGNRYAVWRHGSLTTYPMALTRLIPLLRDRCLLD